MLTTWNLKNKSQIAIITVVLSICDFGIIYTKLPLSQIAKQNNFICGFGIPDTVTANFILTIFTCYLIHYQLQFIAIKSQVRINICNNKKLISTIIYLYLNTVKKNMN